LDNPSFCSGGGGHQVGISVTQDTGDSITIQAGKKTLVFKSYEAGDVDYAMAQERDVEAQKIFTKTEELNALFVDVGKLVQDQQVQIDEVANNIDTAEDATREGLEQLNQAVDKQKSRGKCFCYFAIFLLIVSLQ